MIPIADTREFQIGCFTVQQRPRPDNPAVPAYVVFIGERLIGKSFSLPNIDCCESLLRQTPCARHIYAYAHESAPLRRYTMGSSIKRRAA
jgi:hypothetical protein